MNLGWIAVALALSACATTAQNSGQSAQRDAILRDSVSFAAGVGDVESEAHHLSAIWRDVADSYDRAAARYRMARDAYDAASAIADRASGGFAAAQGEFEYATKMWKFYEQLVRVAAAIDAANLDASRASGSLRDVECQPMTTAQYRRVLERRGVDLTGKDIDHIVPHSLGGADDVSNYEVLDSSLNRSIGAMWGPEKCEKIAGMPACVLAVAVSRRCNGFSGPMPW